MLSQVWQVRYRATFRTYLEIPMYWSQLDQHLVDIDDDYVSIKSFIYCIAKHINFVVPGLHILVAFIFKY
jgi:hypothetical protein